MFLQAKLIKLNPSEDNILPASPQFFPALSFTYSFLFYFYAQKIHGKYYLTFTYGKVI